MRQRYDTFRLNRQSPLYEGLFVAQLGDVRGDALAWNSATDEFHRHCQLQNGTAAGVTRWVPELGRIGWLLDANADQFFVNVIDGPSPIPSTHRPITYACWFKPKLVTGTQFLMGLGGTSTNYYSAIYLATTTLTATQKTTSYVTATVGTVVAAEWQHMAGTFNYTTGHSRYAYLNGRPGSENTTSSSLNTAPTRIAVGAIPGSTTTYTADGTMADAFMWARALSSDMMAAIADRDNVLYTIGNTPLILPPRRTVFCSATADGAAAMRGVILGGGLFQGA